MNNQQVACLDRFKTALSTDEEGVKNFVLNKTRLNGKRFSLKNHEYQGFILQLAASPNLDLVIQKPAQLGISEIIYRVLLSYMARIQGFSAALVFPAVKMSNEVMQTRIQQIIDNCEPLKALKNSQIDSSSVKMFLNASILYALGASPQSNNTVINRPIRMIVTDELARCDLGVITALRSRQRHQENKSSIYFSTPLFEGFDIDAEMQKCGVIYEQLFSCARCNHEFFPDFYRDVRLPGFDDQIKFLKIEDIERKNLTLEDGFLECPSCHRQTTFEYEQTRWVNTSDQPLRPKTGVRLSAFAIPRYVGIPEMLRDLLAYDDRNEFEQQVLGKPASRAETIMNTAQIQFVRQEPGAVNVWGLDVGKTSCLTIGSITHDGLYIHTRAPILLQNLEKELSQYISQYKCVAGVVDFMPYTDISTRCVKTYPNCWASLYADPTVATPELFKLKVKEDEAVGSIRLVTINKTLYMDNYVNELMEGKIIFSDGEDKPTVLAHHEAMRRIRNPKFSELRYQWVKPNGSKTQDHWMHSAIYCSVAARLMVKGTACALPLTSMVKGFRLKSDV